MFQPSLSAAPLNHANTTHAGSSGCAAALFCWHEGSGQMAHLLNPDSLRLWVLAVLAAAATAPMCGLQASNAQLM
jgi:hypothetical protein